ncbi:MAG: MFS transporter [Candidatus Gracilibacteria bacterium]|nr:MFS transporter [Candidatus Gracilibacteria bacterium]
MNKTKIIILLVGFLDILGIGIFIPTLPELAKYYEVSAHSISYAIVLYAFFSFLASPILGQLSDKYGRKSVLILCVLGTFIANLIMSISDIFIIFLVARMINGFTGGNISVLQSMLSDISTSKKDRMSNLGLIGALFGLGFIVGPILGSLLLPFSIKAPFWFMTGLAFFEFFIVIIFLKETNSNKVNKKIKLNPTSTLIKFLKEPKVNLFLVSFFMLILSFSMYQGMFPVYLNIKFGIPGNVVGYIMAGVGVMIAFNQSVLLKRFWLKYFQLKNLFLIINFSLFILFIILSLLNYFPAFISVFYIMVLFSGVVNPIYAGEIVESTNEHDRGEIMGVLASLQSISMFIGPSISGILIDKNISIFIGGALIIFINLIFLNKLYKLLK